MRHLALHIFLLIASFESFSQTLVWEKLIDYTAKQQIYSVDQDSDTTFVFTCPNGTNTFLVKAKLNGDTIWRKTTNVQTYLNYERIATYRNGQLMHFGSKCINSFCDSIHFLFQKYDSNGNLLASWNYGDNGVKNGLENFALLPDGGFLASGRRKSTYYYYLSLMKLDSSGNMLWYKKYRDISFTTDVIVNRNGNYLLSASTGDQIISPVLHPYFIEVSPDGDSITSKYLIIHADTVNEEGNPAKWDILQNENGDYVFTVTVDSVDVKGGPIKDRYTAVVMMDTLFNIKWKLYLNKGTGGNYYPTRVQELKDSSYVLIIFNGKLLSNQFFYYKISKSGQVLDQKIFTSGICSKLYIPAIKLLSDGSLIVSGACNDASPENAYIARIDSVGLPMVITTTAPPKPKPQASDWSVELYPNPFNISTTFRIIDKPGSNYTLTLFNSLGQESGRYKFTGNEHTLERSSLSQGLYLYKITNDKGETRIGKLVAE